eukprot:219224-Rhodomonas_salina.4
MLSGRLTACCRAVRKQALVTAALENYARELKKERTAAIDLSLLAGRVGAWAKAWGFNPLPQSFGEDVADPTIKLSKVGDAARRSVHLGVHGHCWGSVPELTRGIVTIMSGVPGESGPSSAALRVARASPVALLLDLQAARAGAFRAAGTALKFQPEPDMMVVVVVAAAAVVVVVMLRLTNCSGRFANGWSSSGARALPTLAPECCCEEALKREA